MMKLLVIAQHVGQTAPGIVFEALIRELSQKAKVDIITCYYKPSADINDGHIISIKEPSFINNRFTAYADRISNLFFGIAWRDYCMGKKIPRICGGKYDAIIAFGSSNNLAALHLGKKYKRKLKIPLYVYLVDACPSPPWWNPTLGSNGIKRFLRRTSCDFDIFASSNKLMLEYQKSFLSDSISRFDVLYTASQTPETNYAVTNQEINFLYIGSLYGLRTPRYLFEAFALFVNDHPTAKLIFVGTNISVLDSVPASIVQNVKVQPFTSHLSRYYAESNALIDIDACVEEDIFLSSKLTNYVFVNRPVICETGQHTPARYMLKGYNSIHVCNHDKNQIYQAMKRSIKSDYDYSERKPLQRLFSPQYNADKILEALQNLIILNKKNSK